jgi:hypothetical protein
LHTLDCDADPPAPAPDIAWLDHPRLSAEEVRAAMDGIEREQAARFGYGTKVFELTLRF